MPDGDRGRSPAASAPPAAGDAGTLARIQRGIERLYRLERAPDVRAFVIDEAARDRAHPGRRAREHLLVRQREGEAEIGLFVDRRALDTLRRHDPGARLDERNLGDLLVAVEGVSHFLYAVFRARAGRPVTALELELQAEVDKYLTCLLLLHAQGGAPAELAAWLADLGALAPDLSDDERDRYRHAIARARAYLGALEDRFVRDGRLAALLEDARCFYRLGLAEKEDHIRALAA